MQLSGNVVLVTGGASGIGLALARRFLDAGSEVIVCGRREAQLHAAAAAHPGLTTRVCDVARAEERIALAAWIADAHPELNVLVNNAGIQRRIRLTDPDLGSPTGWAAMQSELAINLEAPLHLAALLLPHLSVRAHAAIVNVTSGLALVPLAGVPVYCATKAALHSFTLSMRHQLAGTTVRVVEVLPPAVDTDLGGAGLHTFGVPLDPFADAVMERLAAGELEIAYGTAEPRARAAHAAFDETFVRMNAVS